MVGPENLRAVGHLDRLEAAALPACAEAKEEWPAGCQSWVRITAGNSAISALTPARSRRRRHGQRAAGAEIVLDVDDDKGFVGIAHGVFFAPRVGKRPAHASTAGAALIGRGDAGLYAAPCSPSPPCIISPGSRIPPPCASRCWTCARAKGSRGTLLLAGEGINGTIAGTRAGIDAVLAHLRGLPGCDGLEWKESRPPRRRSAG